MKQHDIMKKIFFAAFMFLVFLLALENCKREAAPGNVLQGTKYILQIPYLFPPVNSPYKDSLTYEGIALGRRLFYDKHLSIDGQKSCASCHHLQYALSDSGNALSINENGFTVRNAPALQNLAWSPYFFWDGRSPTLAAQAQDAFQHELDLNVSNAIAYLQTDTTDVKLFNKAFGKFGAINANNIYLAIQQFLFSAVSANSRFDSVMRGQATFTVWEDSGFNYIFLTEKGDCFHCHAQGQSLLMYDAAHPFRNNGLDSAVTIYDFKDPGRGHITGAESDYGLFKIPTLRNVAVTGPYMHDGRFKTLMQVINFYSDSIKHSPTLDPVMKTIYHANGGSHFTDLQKMELMALLNSFTDTSFLNNPNLKSPF